MSWGFNNAPAEISAEWENSAGKVRMLETLDILQEEADEDHP
jgi:hypothetical protein